MTKEITLNIAERLYATDLCSMYKGNSLDGALIIEGAKQILLTNDELEKIGYKQEGTQRTWQVDKTEDKTMTLNRETVDYLLAKMKERDDAKEVTFGEIPTIQALREKLQK